MEYTLYTYKQNRGSIHTTSDGHKHLVTKRKDTDIYFEICFYRIGCNSNAKLNQDINKISLSCQHNHGFYMYNDDIYPIKKKCNEAAKSSGVNPRRISMTRQE